MRACIDIGGSKVAVSLAADAPGADGLTAVSKIGPASRSS